VTQSTVFLFDIDNTLLDNDAVAENLRSHLDHEVGPDREKQYWEFFEELRTELGYADYLGALQRYRNRYPRDHHLLEVAGYLLDYPFEQRVYAGSMAALARANSLGRSVIFSDGDAVFQPLKARRSGISAAVDGRVLIYIHKEQELDDVLDRYPADHYVLIDDKLRILSAVKQAWGSRVTTVFPRQGHYAHDPKVLAEYPPADITIERIGDFNELSSELFAAR
jgi:FMN phosphatase YigB (HAD superfamily)